MTWLPEEHWATAGAQLSGPERNSGTRRVVRKLWDVHRGRACRSGVVPRDWPDQTVAGECGCCGLCRPASEVPGAVRLGKTGRLTSCLRPQRLPWQHSAELLSLYHVDRHPRFTPSFAPPDCECDGYAQSPATSLQAEPLSSAAPRVHQPQTFWLQKVASLLTTD